MKKADKQIAKEATEQFLKDIQEVFTIHYGRSLGENIKRGLRIKKQKEEYGNKNKWGPNRPN